jgi:hypothetical protein
VDARVVVVAFVVVDVAHDAHDVVVVGVGTRRHNSWKNREWYSHPPRLQ